MKIYLVRHGEAVSEEVNPERPLSPQGTENIEKIARHLGGRSFPLVRILHSQKLRAKQTAEIMQKFVAPEAEMHEHPQMAPNDPIDSAFVQAAAGDGDSMMVGHLPYLQCLLGHMVAGNDHMDLVRFGEGTTVCVSSVNGRWIIDWVLGLDQV
ncbi:MAG: phosphohistidine phosphatase SixA [Simkaniaceae bacterium]|nr:phosphohistidine phosphatase SixA [Candidatus Sacchlamyda saccharinae]